MIHLLMKSFVPCFSVVSNSSVGVDVGLRSVVLVDVLLY